MTGPYITEARSLCYLTSEESAHLILKKEKKSILSFSTLNSTLKNAYLQKKNPYIRKTKEAKASQITLISWHIAIFDRCTFTLWYQELSITI